MIRSDLRAPTMPTSPPIPVILGETASGKTALAIALAEAWPQGGECVSADSMQIYRGMEIGTGTPTPAERRGVPHHLLGIADPHAEPITVAQWLGRAEAAIGEIEARGRLPIVVGGTHLYVQALRQGLVEAAPPDADLRARLEAIDTSLLRRELEAVDPVAAARIHPADRRRTLRAVEVFRLGGVPLSALQCHWDRAPTGLGARLRLVSLERPVELVNRRINRRVLGMLESGWLEEVRALLAVGPLHRQAAEAVGYRELATVLRGASSLADATEAIKIRTRRYAKQQRTWLRRLRAAPGAIRLAPEGRDPCELVGELLQQLAAPPAEGIAGVEPPPPPPAG